METGFGMDPEARDSMVAEVLKKLTQPLASSCLAAVKECFDELTQTESQCLQSVQDDINSYLLDIKDSADYVKSPDLLYNRLQELQQIKQENQNIQADKSAELKRTRTDGENMKLQLRRAQHEEEAKIRAAQKRLEKERTTFSAYLALCGHVRLGASATGAGELRGCVSVQPSDEATFSVDPAALTAVQVADRLWRLAADGPDSGTQPPPHQLEQSLKGLDIADQDGKDSAPAATAGEDKENEETNMARRS